MVKRLLMAGTMAVGCLAAFGQGIWDDSLNTAKNATYLTEREKAVIFEMNKVRTNPKRYAVEVVEPMIARFVDEDNRYIYIKDDGTRILTNEGRKAVKECIKALSTIDSVGILYPSEGLSRAAKDHMQSQGPTGKVGHSSKAGATPWDRIKKHGQLEGMAGENIDYGNELAQEIVVSLLIDDGVPSRGHRINIMKKEFGVAGVAIGSHLRYGTMCVIDYATGFVDTK